MSIATMMPIATDEMMGFVVMVINIAMTIIVIIIAIAIIEAIATVRRHCAISSRASRGGTNVT